MRENSEVVIIYTDVSMSPPNHYTSHVFFPVLIPSVDENILRFHVAIPVKQRQKAGESYTPVSLCSVT